MLSTLVTLIAIYFSQNLLSLTFLMKITLLITFYWSLNRPKTHYCSWNSFVEADSGRKYTINLIKGFFHFDALDLILHIILVCLQINGLNFAFLISISFFFIDKVDVKSASELINANLYYNYIITLQFSVKSRASDVYVTLAYLCYPDHIFKLHCLALIRV